MKLTILLYLLFPLNLFSQQLTGTWIGKESGAAYLKLVVVQVGDSLFGYTYDEGPGFCQAHFSGSFDQDRQQLKGRGTGFIARSSDHVLAVYNLTYRKEGEDEYLVGTAYARGAGAVLRSLGVPSFAQLKKITRRIDTTAFMLEKMGRAGEGSRVDTSGSPREKHAVTIPDAVAADTGFDKVKKERESNTVQTIYTVADTIQMSLYDNGVVDDDTVTVFFDNRVILNRYRISDQPMTLHLPLTKDGREHVVELFANNLGTIPPNTALIIIMAGKERYEVRASYDLSTNAKIIFQYKE